MSTPEPSTTEDRPTTKPAVSRYVDGELLGDIAADQGELLRLSIAAQYKSDSEERRTAEYRRRLRLYYCGENRDHRPAKSEWTQIKVDEASNLAHGSGLYVLVYTDAAGIESETMCRHIDVRERARSRSEGRSLADENQTSAIRLMEEHTVFAARAVTRAVAAENEADTLRRKLVTKDDEIRGYKDRIQELENTKKEEEGTGEMIMGAALQVIEFAGEVKSAFELNAAAVERSDTNTDKLAQLADLFVRFVAAVDGAPGGKRIGKDPAVRAIADEFEELFASDIEAADEADQADEAAQPIEADPAPEPIEN